MKRYYEAMIMIESENRSTLEDTAKMVDMSLKAVEIYLSEDKTRSIKYSLKEKKL